MSVYIVNVFASVEEMSDFKKPKYCIAATVEGNAIEIIYVVKLEIHTVLAYHCANYYAWLSLLLNVLFLVLNAKTLDILKH